MLLHGEGWLLVLLEPPRLAKRAPRRSRNEPRADERREERVRELFLLVEARLLDELFFLVRVDFLGISQFSWLNILIYCPA